jgi:hypothetical protein
VPTGAAAVDGVPTPGAETGGYPQPTASLNEATLAFRSTVQANKLKEVAS